MPSNIWINILFVDKELSLEELEQETANLIRQLRRSDEIESLERTQPELLPADTKGVAGFVAGILRAEVNRQNAVKVLHFLNHRLSDKPIELEVENGAKRLKLKAYGKEDLELAIAEAKKFIES